MANQRTTRGTDQGRTKTVPPNRRALSRVAQSAHLRFVAMFALSCLGLHGLACLLPPAFIKPLCDHTARTLGDVLNVLGVSVLTVDNVVSGAGLAFRVVLECTVFSMIGLFTCFVCFYPARLNHKIKGLAMGIPALYLGNLTRLTAIFLVSRYDPRLFEVAHLYLGQIFTMCLLVSACLLWMSRARLDPSKGLFGRAGAFLFRLFLISGCTFLLWFEVQGWYIRFLDWFVIHGFILFGYRLVIPHDTAVYYETFNMVTFASLILSIGSMRWVKRATALAAGFGLFFLLHLFHRIGIVLIFAFHDTSLMTTDIFLCDVGQYLLPVLLLLAHAVRDFTGKKTRINPANRAIPRSQIARHALPDPPDIPALFTRPSHGVNRIVTHPCYLTPRNFSQFKTKKGRYRAEFAPPIGRVDCRCDVISRQEKQGEEWSSQHGRAGSVAPL